MALDNPQITGMPLADDNSPSSSPAFPSPSLGTCRSDSERRTGCSRQSPTPPSRSTDNHGHPSCPIPILRSARNSLDAFGSSHASDSSHPHLPSLTQSGSIRWQAISLGYGSRDNNQEQASYYVPLPHGHHRKRRNGSEFDAKYNLPNSPRSTHSDVISALPSPGPPIPTWKLFRTQSRPSAVTSFFRRIVHRVGRSSSSPSGETHTGSESDPTRSDVQKGKDKKQSTFLDNLEERLKAANKLHEEAVTLHMLYESGTVATMKDLRAGLPRPLPQDNALFCEVDLLLAEVWRSYERLTIFWKEEIRHVAEALKEGRIDPTDFEHWSNIHPNLEQTIEFWKNRPPGGDAQTRCSNIITSSSTGVDLGAIASSLSSAIGSLGEALECMSSSVSLQYSQLGRSSFQQVYVAFAGNRELCLSLLKDCADYKEKVFTWCFPSIASPMSFHSGAANDIRERNTELWSEVTGISAKSIQTPENVGVVGAPVRALGVHGPTSNGTGTLAAVHSFSASRATDKDSPELDIMITPPASEPEGLQSTVGLEDGHPILGKDNIFPRYPRERFLHLTWLPHKDKVLVLLLIYAIVVVAIVSLALGLFQAFGTTRPPEIPP